MKKIKKKIINLNFNDILYDKISGRLGDCKFPTYTTSEGDIIYMMYGMLHRSWGLPSVFLKDGTEIYISGGIIKEIIILDRFGWLREKF
jgi:hypothetical protein